MTFTCAGIAMDLSKKRMTSATLASRRPRARARRAQAMRSSSPAAVTTTEKRPALHAALRRRARRGGRRRRASQIERATDPVLPQAVRDGQWKGATGRITVLDRHRRLGARAAAIEGAARPCDGRVYFIANIDAGALTMLSRIESASARRRCLEDLHDAGDDGETPRPHATGSPRPSDWRSRGTWSRRPPRSPGGEAPPECNVFPFHSGWRALLAVVAGRATHRDRGRYDEFDRLLAGAHAADLQFRSDPLSATPVPGAHRRVESQRARREPRGAGYAQRLESLPPTCSSSRWSRTAMPIAT